MLYIVPRVSGYVASIQVMSHDKLKHQHFWSQDITFMSYRGFIHDGLFWLKMLQIAESFIHLTFSAIAYYFH